MMLHRCIFEFIKLAWSTCKFFIWWNKTILCIWFSY